MRHEISPAIEEIVLHALERNPADRFESALEMREALAHPESVVITDRATRQRPKPRLSPAARALLTLAAAMVTFAVMWWAIAVVARSVAR